MKMQRTRSYWQVVAVAGVLGTLIATACTVTTSTDDSTGGTTSFAGTSSTAGTTSSTAGTGGVAAGGSAGSTSIAGTTSVGGTGGTGGTAGLTSFQCDPATGNSDVGTPSSCMPTVTNSCSTCIQTSCCTELGKCYATNPGNQCGYGGPKGDGTGEFSCVQACVIAATADGGVVDADTLGTCSANCATPTDTSGAHCMQQIGEQTNDLIACVNMNCQADCFGG